MQQVARLFFQNVLFDVRLYFLAFLPTLIAKKIIYGGYLGFRLPRALVLSASPALLRVCFSSEHGLFSWTPVILSCGRLDCYCCKSRIAR